jgi:hypothetical protein
MAKAQDKKRGPGRPKSANPKSRKIITRVDAAMWEAIEAHRVANGLFDQAEAVRDLIRRGLPAKPPAQK